MLTVSHEPTNTKEKPNRSTNHGCGPAFLWPYPIIVTSLFLRYTAIYFSLWVKKVGASGMIRKILCVPHNHNRELELELNLLRLTNIPLCSPRIGIVKALDYLKYYWWSNSGKFSENTVHFYFIYYCPSWHVRIHIIGYLSCLLTQYR